MSEAPTSPARKSLVPEILRLHDEGAQQIQIARTLRCTPANVCATLRRYGRRPNEMPKRFADDVIRLHQEGMVQREIARRVGCSQANVSLILRSRGRACRVIVDGLNRDDIAWLTGEAQRAKVPLGVLARAMLVDAIADAREQPAP